MEKVAKYRIKAELQRNVRSGKRRITGYGVYVKKHWWSRWKLMTTFSSPDEALHYINH